MLYPPHIRLRSDSVMRKLSLAIPLFLSAGIHLNAAVVIDEDFSSGAGNFSVASGGTWNVSGGRYVLSNPASGGAGLLGNISVHNTLVSGDFDLSTVVRITGTGSSWDDTAVVFGYQDTNNYYYVSLNESNDGNTKGVFKVVGGTPTELADISSAISADVDYPIEIQRSGSSIIVLLNSAQVASVSDSAFTTGKVGFGSKNDGAQYDDLVVETPSGGGVVFSDDFDDGNAIGWEEETGNWSVNNQEYLVTNYGISSSGDAGWTDYSVRAMVKPIAADYSCLIGRYQDEDNFYQIEVNVASNNVGLWKNVNGNWDPLVLYPVTINANTWYELKLEMVGNVIKGYFNGSLVVSAEDGNHSYGKVAVRSNNDTRFDDIEVSEIEVLFSDDFNDGNDNDWTTSGGSWSVNSNEYLNTGSGWSVAGSASWDNYSVQAEVKAIVSTYPGVYGRLQSSNNDAYHLEINVGAQQVQLWKRVNGAWGSGPLASYNTTISTGTWYELRLKMDGSSLTGYLDGVEVISTTDTSLTSGKIGLRSGDDSRFDNVIVLGAGSGGGGLVAAPQFSPGGGTYTGTQNVTITTSTSGASIRYTTNGSTPSTTSGTVYSGPVTISASGTLKAIAYKSGMTESSITSAAYTINTGGGQVAAPVFNPGGGTYSSTQNVTITTSTSGASIRYTTNGSTPSTTSGTVYSGPVTISASGTLKAIAYKSGMTNSTVTSASYTINTGGSSGFPTHPNQTGLSALSINRSNLPLQTDRTFDTSDNGAVVQDVRFESTVTLSGTQNITFRRCWFQGGGYYSLRAKDGAANVTVEDCDFGEPGAGNHTEEAHITSFGGTNYFRRCYLYNSNDSIKFGGGSTNFIEDCWLQVCYFDENPNDDDYPHTDGVQLNDGINAIFYLLRSTIEGRTFKITGQNAYAYAHEELTGGTDGVLHWGNSMMQSKPCSPSTDCSGPVSGNFYSMEGCLLAGGNYIGTFCTQNGEFVDNVVVRGTAGNTDQGVRQSTNVTISGNTFHDNGATYTGAVNTRGNMQNITAIPNLGL